jgi:hypothetical protein
MEGGGFAAKGMGPVKSEIEEEELAPLCVSP